jgi:hypothetical protein
MNIFHRMNSFLKRLRYGANFDPVRDWLLMLILSIVMLVGIVVWNVWAFSTVVSGGVIGAPTSGTSPTFNRASLDAVHTIFTNRAAEEVKYETGVYSFVDPSQ